MSLRTPLQNKYREDMGGDIEIYDVYRKNGERRLYFQNIRIGFHLNTLNQLSKLLYSNSACKC